MISLILCFDFDFCFNFCFDLVDLVGKKVVAGWPVVVVVVVVVEEEGFGMDCGGGARWSVVVVVE